MPEETQDPRIMQQRPVSFSSEFLRRLHPDFTKQEKMSWEYIHERDEPVTRLTREGGFAANFVPEGDDYVVGILPAGEATHRLMAGEYPRGLLARNRANESIVAQQMLRGREKLTGMGKLSEERDAFLRSYIGQTSNWLKPIRKQLEPGAGIGWDWFDSPIQLLDRKMPGFTTKKQLDELSEEDPQQYAYLITRYESREALEETIGETNNPDHFFFALNSDREMTSIQKSLSYHVDQMGTLEETWALTVWPFLRDGLLNDPDMPASLALSIATAGTGAAIGGVAIGLKVLSAGKKLRAVSRVTQLSKIANFTGKYGTRVAKVSEWLPENIATTLARKYWKGYPKSGVAKHLVVNPILNYSEGMIEGSGAEFLGQTMKINYNLLDSYDAGMMWDEALMEGAFNVVANPLLGGLMSKISNIALGMPMAAGGKTLLNKLPDGRIRESVIAALQDLPEGTNRLMVAFEQFDNASELADTINKLLGSDVVDPNNLSTNKMFTTILEPLLALTGEEGASHSDIMAIAETIEDIRKRTKGTLTPEGLIDELGIEIIANYPQLKKLVDDASGIAKFKIAALRYMKEKGIEGDISDIEINDDVVVDILKHNPSIRPLIEQIVIWGDDVTSQDILKELGAREIKAFKDLNELFLHAVSNFQKINTKIQEQLRTLGVEAKPPPRESIPLEEAISNSREDIAEGKAEIEKRKKEGDTSEELQTLEENLRKAEEDLKKLEDEYNTTSSDDSGLIEAKNAEKKAIEKRKKLGKALADFQASKGAEGLSKAYEDMRAGYNDLISSTTGETPKFLDISKHKKLQEALEKIKPLLNKKLQNQLFEDQTNVSIKALLKAQSVVLAEIREISNKFGRQNEIEAAEKNHRAANYRVALETLRVARENAEKLGLGDLQVSNITEAIRIQKEESRHLDAVLTAFETIMTSEGAETVTKGRLAKFMPRGKVLADLKADPDTEISVEEALKLLQEETEREQKRIKQISPGWFVSLDPKLFKNNPDLLSGLNINTIKDAPVTNRSNLQAMRDTEARQRGEDVVTDEGRVNIEQLEAKKAELQTKIDEAPDNKGGRKTRWQTKIDKIDEEIAKTRADAGPREDVAAPTSLFSRPDPTIENWNDAAQVIDRKVNEMPVEQAVRSIEKAIATIKEDPTIPEHIKTMLLKKAENKMVGLKKDLKLKQIADKKGRRFFDVEDWLAEDFGESGWGHVVGGDVLVSVVVDGDGHLDPAFNVDNQGIFVNRGPGQAARIRLQNKGGMAPLLFGDTELGKLGIEVSQKGEPVIKTKIPLKDALVPDAKLRALDVILNELDFLERTIDNTIIKKIADNLGISESVVRDHIAPVVLETGLGEIQSRQEIIDALDAFHGHLSGIRKGPWARDGIVPIFVIDSALAHSGGGSLFDVNIITLVRDAIRNLDGSEIDSRVTGQDLLYKYDSLTVDIDVLMQAVARLIASADKDIASIVEADLKTLIKRLRDPNSRESKNGLLTSLHLVKRLGAATKKVHQRMYEDNGFILDWDRESGNPKLNSGTKHTIDQDIRSEKHINKFLSGIRKGAAIRLEGRIINRHGYRTGRIWKHIKDQYGVTEGDDWDLIVTKILKSLETEDRGITRSDLIAMGNGELSYQPANKLGYQVIDYILTRDGIISLEAKAKRDFRDSQVTQATEDLSNFTGESTRVLPYLFGELNSIAPEKLSDIALMLEDDLLRTRIKFVTSLNLVDDDGNLTSEFHRFYKEWKDMVDSGIELSNNPRGINVKLTPGIRLRPHIQQALLGGKPLSLEETEDILVDLMMNHAQTGYYYIHDSRFTSGKFSMIYRDKVSGGVVDEYLTLGDPTVVPMSNIGSVLALEQMNPYLDGLSNRVIDRMIRLEREWHEKGIREGRYKGENYWEDDMFWMDVLDPKNQLDRKFNGYFVTKILGLHSKEAKDALDRLVNDVLENHVPDMYMRVGMNMWSRLTEAGETRKLGPLESIFSDLERAGKLEEKALLELLKSKDTENADLRRKAEVLRNFLKHPIMTKLYSAGLPSWKTFWSENGKGFEYGGIWDQLQEIGVVTQEDRTNTRKGIPSILLDLGVQFHNANFEGTMGLLSAALGLDKYKARAISILQIDERHLEGAYDTWAQRVEAMTGNELPKNHKLKRTEALRRQLEYNMLRQAENRGEDPEEFRSKYYEKIADVEKIFERAEKDDNRDISKDEHDEIMSILTPHGAWKENQLFYALNLMNSSGFKMAMDAMQRQAELFGYKFDAEWFMGLEEYIMYQVYLPGQNSQRTYATEASLQRHHHTVQWGKIMDNPQKFAEFNSTLTEEDIKDPNILIEKIWKWVQEQEGESPLGVWQATDNIEFIGDPASMTQEELESREQKVRNKVKAMMLQENLLGLAMFDALPIESYTAENNQVLLEFDQMERLANLSQQRGEEYVARRRSMVGLRDPDLSHEMGKVGVNPREGQGTRILRRGRQEIKESQAFVNGQTVFEEQGNPMGVFAWQPLMERTPFLSLGNLELQARLYDAERENVFGPLELLEHDMYVYRRRDEAPIIPLEHRNHTKPWDALSLPATVPVRSELIDSLAGLHVHPARREAAIMELNFRNWLKEQGLEHYLDTTLETFDIARIPYLYLAMKADEWLEGDLDNITRAVTMVEEGTAREASTDRGRLQHAANMWKLGLGEMTELSRNILYKIRDGLPLETKGHEIGITDPNLRNKTITEILTSIYDPMTNPHGHLMSPTLMHKALGIGMVLGEEMIITQGKNPDEGIRRKEGDTDIWPLIVQNNDSMSYLVSILWDSYLWKAIITFNEQNDGKYRKIKTVGQWNKIAPEDRQEIVNIAKEIASVSDNPIIEFTMIAEETDDPEFRRLVLDDRAEEDKERAPKFRNAFGSNFSALVRVNRIIKGATIKLALTPEAALLMLSSNTNYPLLRRMEIAYHNNKMLGVKRDESGNKDKNGNPVLVPIEPESQIIKNEYGYNMRAEIEKRTLESDGMKIMIQQILGRPLITGEEADFDRNLDKDLHVLEDGTRQIGKQHPTIINWAEYRTGPDSRSYPIDALLSSLRIVRYNLETTGLGSVGHLNPDFDILPLIDKMLERVEYHNLESPYTQEAVILSLMLRNPEIGINEVAVFFDLVKEDVTDDELNSKLEQVRTSYQRAKKNYHKIQRLAQLPDSEIFNQYYWDARLFLERIIDGLIEIPVDSDIAVEFARTLTPLAEKRAKTIESLNRKLELKQHSLRDWEDAKDSGTFFERIKEVFPEWDLETQERFKKEINQNTFLDRERRDIIKIEERIATLIQEGIDLTGADIEMAQLALAAATKEQNQESPEILTEISRDAVGVRNHSTFRENYPELANLSQKIDDVYGDSLKARMMRSILVRVFQIQPSIIINLDLTFDTMDSFFENHGRHALGFAEKTIEGEYEIGLVKDEKTAAGRLAYIFAHELAHIGMTKYIQEGSKEWREWRRLFLSDTGKQLIRKVILAARDNVWSTAAQAEYDYYMDARDGVGNPDPTEFIAAITGYYVMNDSLPLISNLTKKEADFYNKTEGILKRVLRYVHRMMTRLSTVFAQFKTEAPEEWKALQNLIYRTMGHEFDENLINNPATGPMYMTVEPTTEPDESTILKLSGDQEALLTEMREIENKISQETRTTKPIPGKLEELSRKLEEVRGNINNKEQELEELGANHLDPWGLTLGKYVYLKKKLMNNFTIDGIIDVERVLKEGGSDLIRALASLITREMRNIYAGKDGEFGVLADTAMENLPYFSDNKSWLRKTLAAGMIGSTGANYTWNSPFQLLVWLSTLIDNSLTTVPGHWGNLQGLPSVVSALGQVEQISTEIGNLAQAIDQEIVGFLETHLRTSQLFDKKRHEETKNRIGQQIIQMIEGEIEEFTEDAIVNNVEIKKLAEDMVSNYILLFDVLKTTSEENSGHVLSNVQNRVPYRFATGLLSHERATTEDRQGFEEEFSKLVVDRLKHNRARIDPFVAYAAGILPTILISKQGIKEMKEIKKKYPGIYNRIILFAELERLKEIRHVDSERELLAELKENEEQTVNRGEEIMNKADSVYYGKFVTTAVKRIMAEMGSLNEESGTVSTYNLGNNSNFRSAYESVLGRDLTEAEKVRVKEVATSESGLSSKLIPTNTNPHWNRPIRRITDIHVRDIVNGAGVNAHFPKIWSIPSVSTVMKNPKIARLLVWHPETLADGIMRSAGQDVMLQSMLKKTFGITAHRSGTTPAHLLLEVFQKAVEDTTENMLVNDDGTVISSADRHKIRKSLATMKEKLDVVLGRTSTRIDGADGMMNFLAKYAPDMVRIIYGTNLTLATMIVENSMNIVDNLFGRGSISGFIESVIAPIRRVSPEIRKTVARDQSDILRAFSQGFVPDFATPGSDIRTNFFQKLPKWLGERNMHMAGHIHEMIATSRAIIFRNWMRDNLENGKLAQVEEGVKNLKPTDLKGMRAVMKKIGLPVPDAALLSYLISEGLFSDGSAKLDILKDLISKGPTGIYHLGDMIKQTSLLDTTEDPRQTLDVIQALKRAEKQFIQEVLVNPNPFDSMTDNGSWNVLIEIFRRYPVLFGSQQIFRKMDRFSPSRMAMNLVAYALFDMMYMTSLMLAVGHRPEDIMDKWRTDPVKTLAQSMARLPHLGRYFGLIAESFAIVAGWGYGSGSMQVIPLSAVMGMGKNILGIAKEGTDPEQDIQPYRLINAARVVLPAEVRMVLYQILGEDYMRQVRGSSKTGKRGSSKGTHAATSNAADPRYVLRAILNEAGLLSAQEDPIKLWNMLPPEMQTSLLEQLREAAVSSPYTTQVLPTTPETEAPQAVSPGLSEQGGDMITRLKKQPTAMVAPSGLS